MESTDQTSSTGIGKYKHSFRQLRLEAFAVPSIYMMPYHYNFNMLADRDANRHIHAFLESESSLLKERKDLYNQGGDLHQVGRDRIRVLNNALRDYDAKSGKVSHNNSEKYWNIRKQWQGEREHVKNPYGS